MSKTTKPVKKGTPSKAVQAIINEGQPQLVGGLVKGSALNTEGFTIKSRSPMLKPSVWEPGMALMGRFKGLIPCTAQPANGKTPAKMGNLIEIVPDGGGIGRVIPATAVLRGAFDITGTGDEATSPHIGKMVIVEKLAERLSSKQGQEAWNFLVAIKED